VAQRRGEEAAAVRERAVRAGPVRHVRDVNLVSPILGGLLQKLFPCRACPWSSETVAQAEQKMAALNVYQIDSSGKLPGNHLAPPLTHDFNSNLATGTEPYHVDREQRAEYGYSELKLELARSSLHGLTAYQKEPPVLLLPPKTSDTAVLFCPGFGRCADHFELRPLFKEQLDADLCGLDFAGYGRAYAYARDAGAPHLPYNMIQATGEDYTAALEQLRALGYSRIVLWCNSTAGLTVTLWLSSVAAPAGLAAVVLDSPAWVFQPSVLFGLRNRLFSGNYCLLKWVASLLRCVPGLVLATDEPYAASDPPTDAERFAIPEALWLDTAALLTRVHRFDRALSPQRGKPVFAGYMGKMIGIQQELRERHLPCGPTCLGDSRIAVPALLLTVRVGDETEDPLAGVIDGIEHRDPHLVPSLVRSLLPRFYADGASVVVERGHHEMLLASEEVIQAEMLAPLRELLLAKAPPPPTAPA